MREIKFRLVCYKMIAGYEKWYPGVFTKDGGREASPQWLYSKDGKFWNPDYIFHTQKDQFVGLFDKNGIEIYEGDILRILDEEEYQGDAVIIAVEFKEGCFVDSYFHWTLACIKEYKREVIGNIYENPELLKEERLND